MTSTSLAAASWTEIPPRATVFVPVGSLEQHGPHLPLDTDSVIAAAVARSVADRFAAAGVPVLVAPTIGYGSSGEHQAFAGTTSIGTAALELLVIELVRSLRTWAGEIVLVNGHGGNAEALAGAVRLLRAEGDSIRLRHCAWPGSDAHAGHTETSLMLWLDPGRVRLAAAAPGAREPVAELMPRLRSGGVAAVSPNGVLGDPTHADARAGARILAAMTESIADSLHPRPEPVSGAAQL